MSNIIKARVIEFPADLPEKMDKIAGHPEGDLRNILAESGKLHDINDVVLSIQLGKNIAKLMRVPDLPEKPMSVQRLSDISWVTMIAYILGTISFDDEGRLVMGAMNDLDYIERIMKADVLEFTSGIQTKPGIFLKALAATSSPDSIDDVYYDMVGRGPIKKKRIEPIDATDYAMTLIKSSNRLIADKSLWGELNK